MISTGFKSYIETFPYFIKTVTLQSALNPSTEAVIVALPSFNPVTFPFSTVATWVSELDHFISSTGVASEGLIDAIKVSELLIASPSSVLFRLIPLICLRTDTLQDADLLLAFAVIVASPFSMAFTFPASTVATVLSEEFHSIVPSHDVLSGRIVAINVSSSPSYSVNSVLLNLTSEISI